MVDLDPLLADLRKSEAFLAECELQRCSGVDHVLRDHWLAGLHTERLAQRCGFGSRSFQAGQLDRAEGVLRARLGSENDGERVPRRFDPRLDDADQADETEATEAGAAEADAQASEAAETTDENEESAK